MRQAMGTWAALLLADPSPCLRLLVLRDLLLRPEDDLEVRELVPLREAGPPVADLLLLQADDGSWTSLDLGRTSRAGQVFGTAHALMSLGYLGFGPEHPAVQRGAEYLFSQQRQDGSWPLPQLREGEAEGYQMIPLQTAFPLRGLAMCGCALGARLRVAAGAAAGGRRLANRACLRELRRCGGLPPADTFALGLSLQHHRGADLPGTASRTQERPRGAPGAGSAAGAGNTGAARAGI